MPVTRTISIRRRSAQQKPQGDSQPVQVFCPACGFANTFWGKTTADGTLIEHFGRRCQGWLEDDDGHREQCDFRFRFKNCPQCNAENDIAARRCQECDRKCWSTRTTC